MCHFKIISSGLCTQRTQFISISQSSNLLPYRYCYPLLLFLQTDIYFKLIIFLCAKNCQLPDISSKTPQSLYNGQLEPEIQQESIKINSILVFQCTKIMFGVKEIFSYLGCLCLDINLLGKTAILKNSCQLRKENVYA